MLLNFIFKGYWQRWLQLVYFIWKHRKVQFANSDLILSQRCSIYFSKSSIIFGFFLIAIDISIIWSNNKSCVFFFDDARFKTICLAKFGCIRANLSGITRQLRDYKLSNTKKCSNNFLKDVQLCRCFIELPTILRFRNNIWSSTVVSLLCLVYFVKRTEQGLLCTTLESTKGQSFKRSAFGGPSVKKMAFEGRFYECFFDSFESSILGKY